MKVAAQVSALGAVALSFGIVYHSTLYSISSLWSSSYYQHGPVAVALCALFIWLDRRRLEGLAWRFSPAGLLLMLVCELAWLIGKFTHTGLVEHIATYLLFVSTIYTLGGWYVLRPLAFPLVVLLFAIPFGDGLVPYLIEVTAEISSQLFQLFGIAAFRQGAYFDLAGGRFVVAEICSGFQMLLAGLLTGILAARYYFHTVKARVFFVASIAVVMVLQNGLRAFTVMAVASASNMRWLAGYDHVVFGWILFGVVWLAILYAAEKLRPSELAA